MDEQSTSTLSAGASNGSTPAAEDNINGNHEGNFNYGHAPNKMLRRLDTVPDIKRDTSGITTQYIATGIGKNFWFFQ